MQPILTMWRFEQTSILFILDVIGESHERAGVAFLLKEAINLIDIASTFKGRLYYREPEHQITCASTVSFALVFPSRADMVEYCDFLQQQPN